MKSRCWMMVAALAAVTVWSAARAANPITAEGEFLSDPAPRVGPDGRLWLFGSRDVSPRYYCSSANDVMVTDDMVTWRRHNDIFRSQDIPGVKTMLYAPDAIFHDGQWRLFYCTPSRRHSEGVASAPRATGPFAGAHGLTGCRQIDPSVFRDDDGKLYYFFGQFALSGAILKNDLSGFEPGSLHTGIIDEKRHHFHEGVQLLKRKGLYYLVYTDIIRGHPDRASRIGYATAKSPFGPYTYRGVIVDNNGCDPKNWNDHGGIVEFKGRWYVFYHRATNNSNTMRKACVEPISFDAEGLIRPVEMTTNGADAPLDPFVRTEARLACALTGHVRIVTHRDRQERLAGVRAGDTATWRYFDFAYPAKALEIEIVAQAGGEVRLLDERGAVRGGATFAPGDGRALSKVTIPLASSPTGCAAVKLAFHGAAKGDLAEIEAWRFRR